MLGVGALVGALAWLVDRLDIGWDRRWEHRRLTGLYAAGYLSAERTARFALPHQELASDPVELSCWVKKDRSYLDIPGWLVLRRQAADRWRSFAIGKGRPPVGSKILVHVKVGFRIPALRDRAFVRISVLEPARGGNTQLHEVHANEDGLFDVTDLGIV